MSEFSRSKGLRIILFILGSVAVIFLVFSLGVYVGYRRSLFASGRIDNYYRNFYGGPPPGMMGSATGNTHGIVGTVIDVASSSIAVKSQDDDEESVEILQDTVIREMDETISESDIEVGDGIAVIGQPNAAGQIEARLIRIFPASSSLPFPTSPSSPDSSGSASGGSTLGV